MPPGGAFPALGSFISMINTIAFLGSNCFWRHLGFHGSSNVLHTSLDDISHHLHTHTHTHTGGVEKRTGGSSGGVGGMICGGGRGRDRDASRNVKHTHRHTHTGTHTQAHTHTRTTMHTHNTIICVETYIHKAWVFSRTQRKAPVGGLFHMSPVHPDQNLFPIGLSNKLCRDI